MEERLQKLEKEIEQIKERNARVEADKAWEVSNFRTFIIAVIIYLIELRYFINSGNYFINALVTALGFIVSVQSFTFIKKRWLKKHRKQ